MSEILEAPVCAGQVLAVPLHAAGRRARMAVKTGDSVAANAALAFSESGDGADVCAPVCGTVVGLETRRLAAPVASECECVLLRASAAADRAPPLKIAAPQRLLKAAGIAGLGGAMFPAWRKWRPGAKFFIVNAAESDPAISCDAALRAELGAEFAEAAARTGKTLGAENIVIAVPDSAANTRPAHAVKFFPVPSGDLAAGGERLLIRAIAGMDVVPPQIAADFGVISFNAATVAAMDAAFSKGIPLTRRIVTVRENNKVRNIRAPFGMEISRLAELAGMRADSAAMTGGRRARDSCPPDAVVGPGANAVDFSARSAAAKPPAPCVRCGDCLPACPVGLNPMRLHFLSLDSRKEDLRAENISHCLECGRCDDACPSGISLAQALGAARDAVLEEDNNRRRAGELRARHARHQRAMQKKSAPRPADESAKSAALAAALNRAAQK